MSTFTAGDTGKDFTATLNHVDPVTKVKTPANLTGATVAVHFATPDGPLSVTATLDDATAGTIRYAWADTDLSDARVRNWSWEAQVTYSSGKIETFPGVAFSVGAQIA